MWKRGLVDDGWMRFLGMMWVGLKRGGVLLVVLDGSGRQHAGGLGHVPRGGWWWGRRGEATALGLTWTFASTAIAFHSEQLAHNGHSGAQSPSAGHGDPRLPQLACLGATRKPVFTLLWGGGVGGGGMSRFCKATSKLKNAPVVEQGAILSKKSVGWFP